MGSGSGGWGLGVFGVEMIYCSEIEFVESPGWFILGVSVIDIHCSVFSNTRDVVRIHSPSSLYPLVFSCVLSSISPSFIPSFAQKLISRSTHNLFLSPSDLPRTTDLPSSSTSANPWRNPIVSPCTACQSLNIQSFRSPSNHIPSPRIFVEDIINIRGGKSTGTSSSGLESCETFSVHFV